MAARGRGRRMGDRRLHIVSFSLDPTATIDGVALLLGALWVCDASSYAWLDTLLAAVASWAFRTAQPGGVFSRIDGAAQPPAARTCSPRMRRSMSSRRCGACCRLCALVLPPALSARVWRRRSTYALAATLTSTPPLLLLALACARDRPIGPLRPWPNVSPTPRATAASASVALLAASCCIAGGVLLILTQLPSRSSEPSAAEQHQGGGSSGGGSEGGGSGGGRVASGMALALGVLLSVDACALFARMRMRMRSCSSDRARYRRHRTRRRRRRRRRPPAPCRSHVYVPMLLAAATALGRAAISPRVGRQLSSLMTSSHATSALSGCDVRASHGNRRRAGVDGRNRDSWRARLGSASPPSPSPASSPSASSSPASCLRRSTDGRTRRPAPRAPLRAPSPSPSPTPSTRRATASRFARPRPPRREHELGASLRWAGRTGPPPVGTPLEGSPAFTTSEPSARLRCAGRARLAVRAAACPDALVCGLGCGAALSYTHAALGGARSRQCALPDCRLSASSARCRSAA